MDQSSGTLNSYADSVDWDAIEGRGLFHDLEHGMTTVSYLIEAVLGDPALSKGSAVRLACAGQELARLCEVVDGWLAGVPDALSVQPVLLRSLAEQLATATTDAAVTVLPGPEVSVAVGGPLAWRVLSNVVGNAARAAGPEGHVRVSVRRSPSTGETVVDVTDDGPGFGGAAAGRAGMGLRVATSLLASCGGRLILRGGTGNGTTVHVVFPERLGIEVSQETGLSR